MKPLYLKLENINSFREEQTVDFESLTKGERIFCISGDTGSGKSTIFTAMLLSLYHRPQGSKLEDFINLSADKGKIERKSWTCGSTITVLGWILCWKPAAVPSTALRPRNCSTEKSI